MIGVSLYYDGSLLYMMGNSSATSTATLQCSGSVYTRIFLHVINIYLHNFSYTCIYLVYQIMSLVYVYSALYLVYWILYLVYNSHILSKWQVFFHALSYGGAFSHALSYGICPLTYLCHIHLQLQSISSPYSPHEWIIEYMELTSQDFMLSGF